MIEFRDCGDKNIHLNIHVFFWMWRRVEW